MNVYVQRTLTYTDDRGDRQEIRDVDVLNWSAPGIVVLGEPGMGKTCYLRRIAETGWAFRSAGTFVNHPDPASLVPEGARVVIDGLDELAAAQESDPVYQVLGKLVEARCPPFILSCRAADWRGAIARQDIAEEYGVAPCVMTLEPFSRENAIEFLVPKLGEAEAVSLVAYLDERAIPDLYGNPLTLDLFREVVAKGRGRPQTRAELFLRACEVMWSERNDRHDKSPLAGMDRDSALEAAGAVAAAIILSGSEAITLKPSSVDLPRTIPVGELQSLPGGQTARTVVGSRLFSRVDGSDDQFKAIHRSVAEFLGAKWIARSVKDDQARDRALMMMTIDGGVPASLRGIHAWLAQDTRFAPEVIATDPYGVLRYGDADGLSVDEGRRLLYALKALEQTNPYFRAEDWGDHPAKGLTHLEFLEDIRSILLASDTTFHLRTLLLGVIRGSELAVELTGALQRIMLNEGGYFGFAEREDAARALVALGQTELDWPATIEQLNQMGDEDSTRLALGVMDDIGFERFGAQLISRSILAHLGLLEDVNANEAEHRTVGTLWGVANHLADLQVADVLDALAEYLPEGDPDRDYWSRRELARLIAKLIARQLKIAAPTPLTLLKWLRVVPGREGYSHEPSDEIATFIRENDDVRHAIQHHALFVERRYEKVWTRIWRLADINSALALNADDVIHLLGLLPTEPNPKDDEIQIWRELSACARRVDGRADGILDAARPFAQGNAELEEHLVELAKPLPRADWEIEREERRAREERERQTAWDRHRKDFGDNIAALRAGELRWSLPASQAYFAFFSDSDRDLSPPDRIGQWLGPELQAAALHGFEAVLTRSDLPTAQQVADGYAESRQWNFIFPMMAGVVQRITNGPGLESVPVDALIAVRLALHHTPLGEVIDGDSVAKQLDAVLRWDPDVYEHYIRLLIEPSLERRDTHILGLYGFVRSAADKELARRLAVEWLSRSDDIPVGVEIELIDVLVYAGEHSALRDLAHRRAERGFIDAAHRRNWLAVRLLVDFPAADAEIGSINADERDLLWHLRDRLGEDRFEDRPKLNVSPALLGWVVRRFRRLWPLARRPAGVTTGNTNPWDASEFIRILINRLASDTTGDATDQLDILVGDPEDGYTALLRSAAYEQRRARREAQFSGVTIDQLKDVIEERPPKTTNDLMAILLYALKRLQKELRGSDVDTVIKYWRDNGQPRDEDRCTDLLMEDLQRLLPPYGITRIPQADMPAGRTVDIAYAIGEAVLPIECKGQWHRELWSAAETQLDAFYVRDWRSQDRGLYLVYWFGSEVAAKYRLKSPPESGPLPTTPKELRERLIEFIARARRGSIAVEVLDFTR